MGLFRDVGCSALGALGTVRQPASVRSDQKADRRRHVAEIARRFTPGRASHVSVQALTGGIQPFTMLAFRDVGKRRARRGSVANLRNLLTVGQAAEIIGVSPATLRNWDRSGKLKAARNPMNGYRLYRREDIQALLSRIQMQTTERGRR